MQPTPMHITLYDPETSEVRASFDRMFVPWKLLKVAVKIAKSLDPENMTDQDVDALAGLVVEVFGGRFTVAEVNDGADVSEMLAIINQIVAKARGDANPTLPG